MSFVSHTVETAPEGSKPMVEGARKKFGFIPSPVARIAESPELLATFMGNTAAFDRSSLDALQREVVIMAIAIRVECHYCVALHSATMTRQSVDGEVIGALREGKPLADAKLEALRQFTTAVLATSGGVSKEDLEAFFAAGYDQRNALDVVLGVGTYTLSTFANRLTEAPLDAPFEAHRWEPHHTGRNATA
ncbi:carboxymuconolactone decarboxylase family protein [Actinokineospora diospyrosa]|uniref:Alkylhydroperoxidase AhpD family core domain-containing protein n=1 Tax=Actinokineospora diospyrosa TaxID=103728 RepID=A0ABT1IDU5_9PSEU|nr:carboxymuconolactone decarboxylase family protein [Actinokineospora diospyrosa]MCP2270793.1 alkylhydroperoxidase AhpD family core domain-containing protein [Actinokineospora diospyrosa]